MAKNGNTWCKKLMHKQKVHAMKLKLGNEVGVAQYCQKARPIAARALDRETIEDKPLPKPVPSMAAVISGEAKLRPFIAPVREGFKVRGFGKKIAAREVRGFNAVV